MRKSNAPSRKRTTSSSSGVVVKRTRVQPSAEADKGAYTTRVPRRVELKKVSGEYPDQFISTNWQYFTVPTPIPGSGEGEREGRAIATKYIQVLQALSLDNTTFQEAHARVVLLAWRNPLTAPGATDIFDMTAPRGYLGTYSSRMSGQYTILSDKIYKLKKCATMTAFANELSAYTIKNEGVQTFHGGSMGDTANVSYYLFVAADTAATVRLTLRMSQTFIDL